MKKHMQKHKSIIIGQITYMNNQGGRTLATYVLLVKEEETKDFVVYKFGPDENSLGKIKLSKSDGECEEIEKVPGSTTNFYYLRAASKLIRILRENDSVFPDRTSYAS